MSTQTAAAVAETHSAVVFFVGDRAYKLKKPVDLGFLDFRSREAREQVCRQEVELNRRIAPDVYLGVADVLDERGDPCDHLVVMTRMPTDRRLSAVLRTDEPLEDHIRDLARLITRFHAAAVRGPGPDAAATAEALRRRWADNTATLREHAGVVDPGAVGEVERLAGRYLDGRRRLFEQRIADDHACDGHGDLLADDVFLLDDGPRVLDCIEFDSELRYGDVLADVAFLAMDLEHRGRPDLARLLLDTYAADAGDVWPRSLEHHHIAYRAQVRAKVSCIRAAQGHSPAVDEARSLLDLALAHLREGTVRLIMVGGLPGTGKSTVSAGLGEDLGAVVLRSDEIRKDRAGLPSHEPAPAEVAHRLYDPQEIDRNYDALLDRARTALTHGESVVLDATWSKEQWRHAARQLASETASDLLEIRCVAPASVAAERLRRRSAAGDDPSDATPEVAKAMADTFDPWPAALTLGTDRPIPEVREAGRLLARAAHPV